MPDPIKILFVDDEPDLVPLIQQRFRHQIRAGELALVFASDGVEALERLAEDPSIELVVTDINMPRMDGLTLLQRLADLKRRTKAVVVTAYSDMENIRTAMNRGAFDFLTKPLDMSDLQITVEQARAAIERDREAERVRSIFTSLLSGPIASAVLRDFEVYQQGQAREVSVLMSDLSGFSQVSERLAPARVVELLNVYLTVMTDIVEAHGGAIDEFIGDAILVLFGAPVAQDDHAERAVACAVAMQMAMPEVNRQLAERDLPAMEMTAAVNSGEVIVGVIGSTKRSKYGVVGSPVNLTARLQTLAAPGEVLVSEATREAAGPSVEIAETRQATLKGFVEPIAVHAVSAAGGQTLPRPDETLAPLDAPAPFSLSVVDGKQVSSREVRGHLLRASPTRAAVRLDGPAPAPRSDVCLTLDASPSTPFYAKLLGPPPTTDEGDEAPPPDTDLQLRFAALPPEVAALLPVTLTPAPAPAAS